MRPNYSALSRGHQMVGEGAKRVTGTRRECGGNVRKRHLLHWWMCREQTRSNQANPFGVILVRTGRVTFTGSILLEGGARTSFAGPSKVYTD